MYSELYILDLWCMITLAGPVKRLFQMHESIISQQEKYSPYNYRIYETDDE